MNKRQRRQPTLKERLTPCIACFHPLSQRHHLLSFSKYGEFSKVGTIQLCANCHDIYHLFERYLKKMRKDEELQLFAIETEEEKLIKQMISHHSEYLPLLRLAGSVATVDSLISLDDRELSPEQTKDLDNSITLIFNFREYVKQERQKYFKKSSLICNEMILMMTGIDGGDINE